MIGLECPAPLVQETLDALHQGGALGCETMVVWLARRADNEVPVVAEVFRPDQHVSVDYFHIPASSMRQLMRHLNARRFQIVAQVHSHPGRAFHSAADNKWAIVRHVDALSLVLPHFARGVTPATFIRACAAYRLSADDAWEALSGVETSEAIQVV